MIDYDKLLAELEGEKAACQYAYGAMVPAFYSLALRNAIERIKECQGCATRRRLSRTKQQGGIRHGCFDY